MASEPLLSIFFVPVLFVGVWLLVSHSFATTSGWRFLAERYRATDKANGPEFRRQVYRMGDVPERGGVTILRVTPPGLYLFTFIPFRPFHPPLLVPWRVIARVDEGRTLGGRHWVGIELDGITVLRIGTKAFESLAPHIPPLTHAAA
jgi:hypothetical protein